MTWGTPPKIALANRVEGRGVPGEAAADGVVVPNGEVAEFGVEGGVEEGVAKGVAKLLSIYLQGRTIFIKHISNKKD